MRLLELTDDEAVVLWFIGRNMARLAPSVATRPYGKETIESLAAKLAALLFGPEGDTPGGETN